MPSFFDNVMTKSMINNRTDAWKHFEIKKSFVCGSLFCYYIKQVDSMLPCIWSIIGHRRCQNVVRTSGTHSAISSCATYLFLPHFDVIWISTSTSLNRQLNRNRSESFRELEKAEKTLAFGLCSHSFLVLLNFHSCFYYSIETQYMFSTDFLDKYYKTLTKSIWCEVALGRLRNYDVSSFFQRFGGNFWCKLIIKFLRRLNEGHLRFPDF